MMRGQAACWRCRAVLQAPSCASCLCLPRRGARVWAVPSLRAAAALPGRTRRADPRVRIRKYAWQRAVAPYVAVPR